MNYELYEPQHPHRDESLRLFVVDMNKEPDHHRSVLLREGLRQKLSAGQRVLILHNTKGYARGLVCDNCGHHPQCDHCDIGIAYYQDQGHAFGLCHICKHEYPIPDACPVCSTGHLVRYGLGVDQLVEWLKSEYTQDVLVLNSSVCNSLPKMRKMYKKIDNYQLVVASSLVRHWPADITLNVAMMTDADAGIGLPQYTAPADTFRRLYDSIVHLPCRDMIIQTRQPDHPIIRQACGLRREDFEADDKVFRQQHQYPPYGQLAVISYKHETESRVFSTVNKLYKEISYIIAKGPSDTLSWSDDIQSYATPPLVYKMFDKYRYQIIIKGSDIRSLLDHLTTDLRIRERKFQIDRMAREVG